MNLTCIATDQMVIQTNFQLKINCILTKLIFIWLKKIFHFDNPCSYTFATFLLCTHFLFRIFCPKIFRASKFSVFAVGFDEISVWIKFFSFWKINVSLLLNERKSWFCVVIDGSILVVVVFYTWWYITHLMLS